MSGMRWGSAALLALSIIGGCKVDEAAEVRTYRDFLDEGAPAAPDLAAGPLDVRGTMLLTNSLNERLSIEGEEYLQALLEHRKAASTLLPTLALAPGWTLRDRAGNQPTRAFNVPMNAGFSFNLVSDPARIEAAEVAAVARLALVLDAQDTLLLDAARAHYAVLLAERAATVLENSLAVQQQRVDDARGRLEAGTIRPLDLALSESQAAQTAVDLLAARRDVVTGRKLLAFYTATDMTAQPLADELDVPAVVPSADEQLAIAMRSRPDLAAADRTIDAAGERVKAAYGEYFPRISADLQMFLLRETEPTELDWTSLIQLNIPLFSAGVIEADVRIALSELRAAKLLRSELARIIQQQVEVAIANLAEATSRVEQLKVQVKAASDALEQATGLYSVGLATNLEQVEAQDRLLSAQLQLVTAELDRKTNYLELKRATGTLHELVGLPRTTIPWGEERENTDATAR